MTWSVRRLAPRIPIGLLTPVAFACTEPTGSGRDADRPAAAKAPAGVTVMSVSPDSVPRDTTLDIRVIGSGFDDGSQAVQMIESSGPVDVVRVAGKRSDASIDRLTDLADDDCSRGCAQWTEQALPWLRQHVPDANSMRDFGP